jgi:hypothetical protein
LKTWRGTADAEKWEEFESAQFATTVLGNFLTFWNREQLGIELQSGMDEVSLALCVARVR